MKVTCSHALPLSSSFFAPFLKTSSTAIACTLSSPQNARASNEHRIFDVRGSRRSTLKRVTSSKLPSFQNYSGARFLFGIFATYTDLLGDSLDGYSVEGCRAIWEVSPLPVFVYSDDGADEVSYNQTLTSCQYRFSVERNDAAATGPLVVPHPELTAEGAVKAQMDALACNNDPRPDHGLEVLYHFANAEGTLDAGSLSRYFGFASDLYHFGHFALKFKIRYAELIDHRGYEVVSILDNGNECEVQLNLTPTHERESRSEWVFHLLKCERGRVPPCWLTNSLLKHDK